MELRYRGSVNEVDSNRKMTDLESYVISLKQQLEKSIGREKRLLSTLKKHGIDSPIDIEIGGADVDLDYIPDDSKSFISSMIDRGGWLIGLLIFQSCSSFILSSNNGLLAKHPSIVYFLTMLVGAGGNAGNQAAVRVIRGLACGTLNSTNMRQFLYNEFLMSVLLSGILGIIGLLRACLLFETSWREALAITASLIIIVFISIILGSILPIILNFFRIDPAHASTSIQVIMDISGVLITCSVASITLDLLT